ncbi:hypothetical protein P3L10_010195 [Capsicum annuum]
MTLGLREMVVQEWNDWGRQREMARIVREWVETAEIVRIAQPEHICRDMFRLRGRQVLLDFLMRIERERQRELQGLLEHRAVSDFAHHNQIQSLLRGRFLHERPAEEERPPSIAASELVQLRQSNTVSGLRLIEGQYPYVIDASNYGNVSCYIKNRCLLNEWALSTDH